MGTPITEKSYKQQEGAGLPGVEKPDSFRHCTCGLRIRRGHLAPVPGGRSGSESGVMLAGGPSTSRADGGRGTGDPG